MNNTKELQVLEALKKSEPKKKRVTFFITEEAKEALASWCDKHDVTESGTIEELIRSTLPSKFFKGNS